MLNVVSRRDSALSGICQNPELASNFVKTVAPSNCAKVSSTVGSWWSSRRMNWLRGLKSTQIRTDPSGLGTTTMAWHQSVGPSTGWMTPSCSILVSSCSTLDLRGSGTLRGVYRHDGLASGVSSIWYSSDKQPRPENKDGNSCATQSGILAVRTEHLSGSSAGDVSGSLSFVNCLDVGKGSLVSKSRLTSPRRSESEQLSRLCLRLRTTFYLFIYLFIYLWIPQRLMYSINLSRGSPCMYLCTNTIGTEIRWRNRE